MANTYNWRINALDAKIHEGDNDNVIYTVHWSYSATDETGEHSVSSIGTHGVEYDADNFTPYADLTEEQVIGWVKDSLGEEEVLKLEESVTNSLNLKITPDTKTNLPWE